MKIMFTIIALSWAVALPTCVAAAGDVHSGDIESELTKIRLRVALRHYEQVLMLLSEASLEFALTESDPDASEEQKSQGKVRMQTLAQRAEQVEATVRQFDTELRTQKVRGRERFLDGLGRLRHYEQHWHDDSRDVDQRVRVPVPRDSDQTLQPSLPGNDQPSTDPIAPPPDGRSRDGNLYQPDEPQPDEAPIEATPESFDRRAAPELDSF